ncbi:unnamed protein product, partial [Larinioides sclopetarius]
MINNFTKLKACSVPAELFGLTVYRLSMVKEESPRSFCAVNGFWRDRVFCSSDLPLSSNKGFSTA